jgi:hypothetical protein
MLNGVGVRGNVLFQIQERVGVRGSFDKLRMTFPSSW